MVFNPFIPLEFYVATYKAMLRWDKNNTEIWRHFVQMQCEFWRLCLEGNVKQLRFLSYLENPAYALSAQSDMAMELATSMLENMRRTLEIVAEMPFPLPNWFTMWDAVSNKSTTAKPAESKKRAA